MGLSGRLDWPRPLHHLCCTEPRPLSADSACLGSAQAVCLQSQNGELCSNLCAIMLHRLSFPGSELLRLQPLPGGAGHRQSGPRSAALDPLLPPAPRGLPHMPHLCCSGHSNSHRATAPLLAGTGFGQRHSTPSQPLHTVLHSIPLPASRCVCGTLESTICCRQCLSSSPSPSGCLTSVLPRSPLSPFPNPPSLWPATSMLPGSLSAQVKPSPDTEWLPCMLIILISGAMTEGVGSDASHTNPVCAVAYSPLLDQLVSVYLPTPGMP